MDTSDKLKTVFENLREVVSAPITAIAETIQTAVSNLQSDKQEVSPTAEQESLIESESSSPDVVIAYDGTVEDELQKENEQTHSSLIETIREQASSAETEDQSRSAAVTVHDSSASVTTEPTNEQQTESVVSTGVSASSLL